MIVVTLESGYFSVSAERGGQRILLREFGREGATLAEARQQADAWALALANLLGIPVLRFGAPQASIEQTLPQT